MCVISGARWTVGAIAVLCCIHGVIAFLMRSSTYIMAPKQKHWR